MGAAGKLTAAVGLVLPGVLQVAVWLAPLLLVGLGDRLQPGANGRAAAGRTLPCMRDR